MFETNNTLIFGTKITFNTYKQFYIVGVFGDVLQVTKVRKISKCKVEHYKAPLVNKLLRVSCINEAYFFIFNNPKTFVNKHQVRPTFILNHFHIVVGIS